jgi:hypothetical protein
MIFEDAHWADPTSLELFGRIVDRISSLRVLLVVTFRPEFEPPWIGRPYVTALTINRLAAREIGAIIERVVSNNVLPTSIRQEIIERTDGIPLFVEEMTKAVLEAGTEWCQSRTRHYSPCSWPSKCVTPSACKWRRFGHDVGFGIGIAHGYATLGTIGFEGRFDYAAIGTVSNVASRLCDEAKPGQILVSERVLVAVENAVNVEPVGEFELKGIRRPLSAYNVIAANPAN